MRAPELAGALMAALTAAGVRDVVLAPGSRNGPLLLAALAAEGASRLRAVVRPDERGAGFVALGMAKATQRPTAVIVTSGTAVGNLLPAVMEAHHSGVPVVVVTADRPATMRGTGANQTTVQPGLFGGFAPCVEVRGGEDVATLRQAVFAATLARQPVHVNVELAEPLLGGAVQLSPTSAPEVAAPEPGEPTTLPAGAGTVVLVGDAPPAVGRRVAALARAAGVPLLAEPSSNARLPGAVSTYRLLLAGRLADDITRVIVWGRPTLSRPQRALLTEPGREVIQVTRGTDRYPATARIVADAVLTGGDPAWLARWQRADAAVRRLLDATRDRLDGRLLAATVLAHSRGALLLGSSQLIRDADLAPVTPDPPALYANRGLAGIDGVISTATGVALGGGLPTTVLLGDLTALHDLNALVTPRLERRPRLRVVVGNDDGGAIFHTLEQGAPVYARDFERAFAVPHGVGFAAVASALGVPATTVTGATALTQALARPIDGLELIEVPLQRGARRSEEEQLRQAVASLDL